MLDDRAAEDCGSAVAVDAIVPHGEAMVGGEIVVMVGGVTLGGEVGVVEASLTLRDGFVR